MCVLKTFKYIDRRFVFFKRIGGDTMEIKLRQLYQDKASEQDTLGILIIEKEERAESVTDKYDVVFLIIKERSNIKWHVKHYEFLDKKVSMHSVDEELVYRWMITGSNRRFIDWIFNGKVLFDRNEYVYKMKERVRNFPIDERKKKIGLEFSKLIRRFEDGKALFHSQNYLDAFNFISHALHHQARLAVIERGFYPEVTVWNQVKLIEPETYKLYQELLVGEETIEKRVELLLIANEFAISSKMLLGSAHLIHVLKKKDGPWSISEMMKEKELEDYLIDLELFVEYLVQKKLITISLSESRGKGIYHRLYQVIV